MHLGRKYLFYRDKSGGRPDFRPLLAILAIWNGVRITVPVRPPHRGKRTYPRTYTTDEPGNKTHPLTIDTTHLRLRSSPRPYLKG